MSTEFIDSFSPDSPIPLKNVEELALFEDIVATHVIDPHMTVEQRREWGARIKIQRLISPPGYFGLISDIVLTPMLEPFMVLQNPSKDGWMLHKGEIKFGTGSAETLKYKEEHALGFSMEAAANSSGRGKVAQLTAALWYLPASKTTRLHYGGSTVNRVVSVPNLVNKDLEEMRKRSEYIGTLVMRWNIERAFRGR